MYNDEYDYHIVYMYKFCMKLKALNGGIFLFLYFKGGKF